MNTATEMAKVSFRLWVAYYVTLRYPPNFNPIYNPYEFPLGMMNVIKRKFLTQSLQTVQLISAS